MPDNPSPEPLHPAVIIFSKVVRFLNWTAVVLIAFALIGGAVVWSVAAYKNRLRVHTELGGVRLGMTKDDVLFEKGEPDRKKDWGGGEKLWNYENSPGSQNIVFADNWAVRVIMERCCVTVSGIRVGDDSSKVTAKFGEPFIQKHGA